MADLTDYNLNNGDPVTNGSTPSVDGRSPSEGRSFSLNPQPDEDDGWFSGRTWDYILGGIAIVAAVALVYVSAPVWLVVAAVVIAVVLILPGGTDENGKEQSFFASIWDSSATLTTNVSNAFRAFADFTGTPWFWLILIALLLWYMHDKTDKSSQIRSKGETEKVPLS